MMNWWWTDDELMNWWWTDDELMMNWSGLPKTITDCHWLIGSTPLNSQSYIRGLDGMDGIGCITDSTYYKSTASGAKNSFEVSWNLPKTSLCSSHPPARQRCPRRHGRPSQIWGMVVGDNEKPDLDVDSPTWSPERERRRSLPHGKRLAYLVQSHLYWFFGLGKRLENTWKTLGVPDPFSIQFLLFDF